MKKLLLAFAVLTISAWASAADKYEVDLVHSSVLFSVKHLNVSIAYGQFREFSGEFQLDGEDLTTFSGDFQIQTGSIETFNANRDKHLRSPDFFNAKQFPTMTFKLQKVEKQGDTLTFTGELTMLGKTNTVTLVGSHEGAGMGPWGKFRRGFHAKGTIKRSTFGMTGSLDALGDDVEVIISLELIKQ